MRDIVIPPISEVFESWGNEMKKVVGDGNYSMQASTQVSKVPYVTIQMIGSAGRTYDLEGNEIAIEPTFQVDSYADGRKAIENAMKIDTASHKAMTNLGFRRIFGPQIIDKPEVSYIRVISRYSRIYTGEKF